MTTQHDTQIDGHGDSWALRSVRLAAGDKQLAQDNLFLAMQGDHNLRLAVERVGIRKLIASGLVRYKHLVKTGGPYLAAHPEKAEQLPELEAVKE